MHVIRLPLRAAKAPPLSPRRSDRAVADATRHRPARAGTPSVIGRDDWGSLFDAVVVQLRRAVEVRSASDLDARVPDAGRLRARVLECAAALELLRAARVSGDSRSGAMRLVASRP
jgi:hypothetical protein